MKREELDALTRATLARSLMQLAMHFPKELDALELSVPEALDLSFRMAEEAISLAPDLPDGHTVLGRALLFHDDPEALSDARELFQHALELDPEHDPAQIALATVLHSMGQSEAAMAHVEQVIKRGNGQPQPLVLRALIHFDRGQAQDARRDLERAIKIAPEAGLFRLDAARAAEAVGDATAAEEHRQRARELLGQAFDQINSELSDDG